MTVGDGIFWSSLFLGTVALFIATKDRWPWKKIVLWTVGSVATVVIAVVGWLYFAQDKPENRSPYKEAGLWGINLGAVKGDVKFLKGNPLRVEDDGDSWVYAASPGGNHYYVLFKDGKVDVVAYHGESLYAPDVQGINGYDSTESIKQRFGKPSLLSANRDETRRVMSYAKLNLFFGLRQDRVESIGVFDGSRREGVRFREEAR
jgi:hypothetical protein